MKFIKTTYRMFARYNNLTDEWIGIRAAAMPDTRSIPTHALCGHILVYLPKTNGNPMQTVILPAWMKGRI